MSRSPLAARVARALRLARFCEDRRLPAVDGLGILRELETRQARTRATRREWLTLVGRAGAAAAAVALATPAQRLFGAPQRRVSLDAGIVGAGLAGLACADALAPHGVAAAVYDAAERTGGRCWSLRGVFPGQVAERGGEFIDNLHKTMLGYARRFGLAVEDVSKDPGDVVYHLNGTHVPEPVVVDEFRELVAAMRVDLRRLSNEITALVHTPEDEALDRVSLLEYLDGANGAGLAAAPNARAAILEAYVGEYGLDADEQSCLNFLLFIHADRRSKFRPFGVFSDERYHVVDGNDRIVEGLAQALPRPVEHGMTLVAARRTAAGRIELTFDTPGGVTTRTHEAVVLALPFSTLRFVALDDSLGIPAPQQSAIDLLGYGTNAKLLVGFAGRPWRAAGGNGTVYSDLPHVQITWETNASRASADRAVLTDYASGTRGATMNAAAVQSEAEAFLEDFDHVFPGARDAARRTGGDVVAHLEHWPSNPLALGSYTCYRTGQFTTIAGLEGLPAGNVFFAGEHANSFYDWQGFMEGAALSGLEVAKALLRPQPA